VAAYQLNPDVPREGIERRAYRTAKFGSWERSLDLDAELAAVGAGEGIAFHFDRMERTPNTFDAHRLIRLAGERGVQDAVVEALFRAYFTDGIDVGDRKVLLDVAAGAGLDRERAEAELDSDDSTAAIRAEEDEARQLGVEGVPFFVLNSELALTEAREPEAFLAAFDTLSSNRGSMRMWKVVRCGARTQRVEHRVYGPKKLPCVARITIVPSLLKPCRLSLLLEHPTLLAVRTRWTRRRRAIAWACAGCESSRPPV
jgi:predicted DsbA family dithiol-disulfide isomerase